MKKNRHTSQEIRDAMDKLKKTITTEIPTVGKIMIKDSIPIIGDILNDS